MGGPDQGEELFRSQSAEQNFRRKERSVGREDYIPVEADSARCVDDRPDKVGENRGVQFPGGALLVLDLLRVAIVKTGEAVEEDWLWEMSEAVFSANEAQENHILPGVHIDDDHGHLTDLTALGTREVGCGYDSVRGDVLSRLGVEIGKSQEGENIRKARELGWGVQVLTGHHSENASAAINFLHGMTLRTQKLSESGRIPSFNLDLWAVRALLPAMSDELRSQGFDRASSLIGENGTNWSKQIYIETLDILSGHRIGEHDLVEIP